MQQLKTVQNNQYIIQVRTWNRTRVDAFLNFAKNNNITLRMHGPVGPQSSTWAKTDTRTALELETNMTEFLTDLSQRINNQTHVMDGCC